RIFEIGSRTVIRKHQGLVIKIIGKGLVMNFLFNRFGLFCLSLMFCLFSNFVYAETMYVSDILKLTLRTGPSTENKILAVIESGQMLDIVKIGDEWSQAQLPSGKEGWVLSRYLTPNETNNIKLQRLETKHKNLMIQAAELLEENNRLKAENKKLSTEFEANQKQLVKARTDYETLKTEASEFLTLKTRYKRAASQLAEQTAKAEKLEEQLTKLERNTYIKWFLAGSGVLIVGFLIGYSSKRQRRRPALA
ncbi:MAG: TIGR04211 family SH3 domain-containing protein, partial [Desulfobacterales bacterium]|nr:TIGR04211 family SH3 domain-containing protein [Desulfobacterales bacterium]